MWRNAVAFQHCHTHERKAIAFRHERTRAYKNKGQL